MRDDDRLTSSPLEECAKLNENIGKMFIVVDIERDSISYICQSYLHVFQHSFSVLYSMLSMHSFPYSLIKHVAIHTFIELPSSMLSSSASRVVSICLILITAAPHI